ncbi:MAG: hypothetical protein GY789_13985 [Hyphomicrobiales bacterium]|nr:hypothetical protein [Hyphomicrobiales bacterium]MCP4999575.1 hypothetical protein [Hyphomicrobiales bacterium]
MRQWIRLVTLTAVTLGLTACLPINRPIYDPNSIEGQWIDPNGIQSSFSGGKFETRTTDTNTLLATGRYRYVNRNLVQIDIRSLVRNTNSRVNCSLVSPTQLNCTSNSGGKFSLNRRLV